MLIDKGYYDYDFDEKLARKGESKAKMRATKPKTAKQVGSMLARFGFKTKVRENGKPKFPPEEAQRIAMEEIKTRKG